MADVGYGDGTITRRKDGRLQVMVTIEGRRRYAMIPARGTPAEQRRLAERKRRELLALRDAAVDPSGQTLADYLGSWIGGLRDARRARIRPRTLDHYAMIVERHIIPGLDPHDKLPLTRVTERRIQAWLDAEEGSARSIHHRRAVLRLALNRAVRQRLLAFNPAAGKAIELPDPSWDGAKPLSADEAHRLLEATKDSRWHPLWRLAIVTGLRFGELMGLTWDDIEPGFVHVTAQMQRIKGQWVRRPTKAARSLDRISIDEETQRVLDVHRQRMAAERTPEWRYFGHVFTDEHGEPHDHKRVLTEFKRACILAGIEPRRFHDLRHANQTILKDLGIAEDVRMARAGHSTTRMSRRYGKASERQDREAVDRLAEAIR